ncbi:hypothetical protein [uncultured Nocardioides sp.]|uniref:hypothetical protein n=1 Tax=uncultured Nocardioides sp. TaxID=198441 RepID=UPI0026223E01|nr:hypothetical protein [uncultured Nocardioides sp.]
MSRRSLSPNDGRQQRKNAKQQARRRDHVDKYADRRPDPLAERLAELADHFNGQEGHRG